MLTVTLLIVPIAGDNTIFFTSFCEEGDRHGPEIVFYLCSVLFIYFFATRDSGQLP